VRYAAPDRQHLVLGVRERGDVEELFLLALSRLRAGW
jgi:hypothetical protein